MRPTHSHRCVEQRFVERLAILYSNRKKIIHLRFIASAALRRYTSLYHLSPLASLPFRARLYHNRPFPAKAPPQKPPPPTTQARPKLCESA